MGHRPRSGRGRVSYRMPHDGGPWHRRHPVAVDVAIAVFFVLLDTGLDAAGATWWPAHPGTLAWAMLGVQALAVLLAGRPPPCAAHGHRRPRRVHARA